MNRELSIRLAKAEDAMQILEIYNPLVLSTAITFEVEPITRNEMSSRIEKVTQFHPWLVAVDRSSKILGYAYASPHRERAAYRWAVDVSAYVHEGSRGMGIGSYLYKSLFDLLRKQNIFRAFAGITLPNVASVSLHEKLGFKRLGVYRQVGFKLKTWHDVGWWELSLRDAELNPSEPLPISQITS